MEMHEPYTFLNGLTVADMEDLLEDIQVRPAVCPRHPYHLQAPALPSHHLCPLQVYMELEQGKNADFWRDMTIITEDEISKLRKLEASGKGPGNVGQASSVTPLGLAGVRQVAPQKTPILCKSLPPLWGSHSLTRPLCKPSGAAGAKRRALLLVGESHPVVPRASFKQSPSAWFLWYQHQWESSVWVSSFHWRLNLFE